MEIGTLVRITDVCRQVGGIYAGRAIRRRAAPLRARERGRAAARRLSLRALRRSAPGHRQARAGGRGRPALPDPHGRHGLGQDLYHGKDDRGLEPPHAHHGAEQDPGRAGRLRDARVLPEQRRRLLRLVLRLLPARGLRPADRHLYREGLLHQRGGREASPPGHLEPALAPRRDRGRLGELHLRHRQPAGLRGARPQRLEGRTARARRPHQVAHRHPVRPQRLRPLARDLPRAGRHRGCVPPVRREPAARELLWRRGRAHRRGRQRHGRDCPRVRRHPDLAGVALRDRAAQGRPRA